MENAADALKIAFGVLIFVVALSLSIFTFSNARQAIDSIITYRDKTQDYVYVKKANNVNRLVSSESIIPAMYKAYTENYKIIFLQKNNSGEEIPLFLYTKTDYRGNTPEKTEVNYVDLLEEDYFNEKEALKHLNALLSKNSLSEFDKKTSGANPKTLIEYELNKTTIGNNGFYNFVSQHTFEERLGEYYQEDVNGDADSSTLDINKTKKRVVTYVMQD